MDPIVAYSISSALSSVQDAAQVSVLKKSEDMQKMLAARLLDSVGQPAAMAAPAIPGLGENVDVTA